MGLGALAHCTNACCGCAMLGIFRGFTNLRGCRLPALRCGARCCVPCWHAACGQLYLAIHPCNLPTASCSCPTIIWIGDEDITTPPAMAAHYHSRIPGSRLHSVRGEAHLSLPFNHGAAILASLSGPPSKL